MIGIYTIRINDYIYVGSSIDIKRRIEEHFYYLERGQHYNPFLQHLYNKYPNNVEWFIGDICDRESLRDRETWWIQQIPKDIRINISQSGSYIDIPFTEERRQKIISTWTPEKRQQLSNSKRGYHHSEESKLKMSISAKNRTTPEYRKKISKAGTNRPVSEETRQKIRDSLKSTRDKKKQSTKPSTIDSGTK